MRGLTVVVVAMAAAAFVGGRDTGQAVVQGGSLPYSITVRPLARDGAWMPGPVPATAPEPTVLAAGVEQWRTLVAQYPWDVEAALRIMRCESGGNARAYNAGSGASGLFQFLMVFHAWRFAGTAGVFDGAANIAVAYSLWREQGWQPWNVGGCW